VHWTAHHQLQALTHGRHIGSDVDGIGDQQHDHQRVQHRRGEVLSDIVGQAAPGDASQASADDLDRDHQRIGENDGPAQLVSELRACLGIRRDAARVVVRRAGDQARAELAQLRSELGHSQSR